MNLSLKHIDVNGWQALEDFCPEIKENFVATLSLIIGPENQDGAHEYSLTVCSPRYLSHIADRDGPIWGRHILILNRFNAEEIISSINKIIINCSRPTFEESSLLLARYFLWEYEDYN